VAKKNYRASPVDNTQRRLCIDPSHPELSIKRQCELVGLPRTSYYRRCPGQAETSENLALMRLIDEEYTRHPFYGSRKLCSWLRRQGYIVNRKRVQRVMRKMGIQSIAPGPYTSHSHPEHRIYPYLLRNLEINCPNQVWCSDITYVPLPKGFAYLTAIMDWYSRYVLSWEVSVTMESEFCVSALESALRLYGKPEIFNTDQGSQFTSVEFTDTLKSADVQISMDGKGRAMDNIFIERLWRSVKYEEIYPKEYPSVQSLMESLDVYFDFYNTERPHSGLKCCAS
jgi:putative transposase